MSCNSCFNTKYIKTQGGKNVKKQIMALACALMLVVSGTVPANAAAKAKPVELSKTSIKLKVGASKAIKVKKAAKVTIKKKTFTSSDSKVAAVTQEGKVTAKKKGKAVIKVEVNYKNGKKDTIKTLKCKVTVTGGTAIKNDKDALKQLIAKQRKSGATVSEDLNNDDEYEWDDNNNLEITYRATTDAPTMVNLTNHTYFNLDGQGSGTGLTQHLKLNCSRWLPTDETQIPTGEIAPVAGTPMDFTEECEIGKRIHDDFHALKIGKGYDHCWVIDGFDGTMRETATLRGSESGRTLTVKTTQPAVQVYTGNWLEGCPDGENGYVYHDYDAVAIECQGCPDAPNHPGFPSQRLNPGEEYIRKIRFEFA